MIRFDSVGLRYGSGPEILRDLSFQIEAGEFVFVTGASGAGKTSLLRLLYLAERPSRGMIDLFGRAIGDLDRRALADLRRRIGVVFQDFRLIPHLSVFENVALPLRIAGHRAAAYAGDVREMLNWVGLGGRLEARPATLSGGEQQRVALARAVVTRPRLLVADEPTGNVDPEMGLRILRLLVELHKLGTTVVVATHDATLLNSVPARAFMLQGGRIARARGTGTIAGPLPVPEQPEHEPV